MRHKLSITSFLSPKYLLLLSLLFFNPTHVTAVEGGQGSAFSNPIQVLKICFASMARVVTAPVRYFFSPRPPSEIRDQCGSGSCWAHAGANTFRKQYKKKTGMDLDISESALLGANYMSQIHALFNSAALDGKDISQFKAADLEDGAHMIDALDAWAHHGFALSSDVKLDIVKSAKNREELKNKLEAFVHEFSLALAAKKRETSVASELYEFQSGWHRKLRELFAKELGFTGKVKIQGNEYDSAAFFQDNIFNRRTQQLTRLVPDSSNEESKPTHRKGLIYTNTQASSHEEIFKRVKEKLAAGETLYCSVLWANELVNVKTGKVSAMKREGISQIDKSKLDGHAVEIVGESRDADGKIVWKVQNSWGVNSGDRGYYYIDESYLRNFLSSVEFVEPK